jgi:hypothetical protein
MVDTSMILNGEQTDMALPAFVVISAAESQRIPSPGTQRALKAETGRSWDSLVGPDADSADRIQTMIWIHLRRQFPGLRWEQCDEIDVQVEDGADLTVDPTKLAGSGSLQRSADSGD